MSLPVVTITKEVKKKNPINSNIGVRNLVKAKVGDMADNTG